MNSSVTEPGPDELSPQLCSRRLAISISIGWSTLLLLGAWLLSIHLGLIHDFESGVEFEYHNNIHWFRPIAFFWFYRFSLFPSVGLAVLILACHAVPRRSRFITWSLALSTVFLLAVGAYTVWEKSAVMHQFVYPTAS